MMSVVWDMSELDERPRFGKYLVYLQRKCHDGEFRPSFDQGNRDGVKR